VLCGVAQGVEKRLSFDGWLCLEELNAALDVNVRRSHEGAIGMNVIIKNNQTDHHAQDEEVSLFALDLR
jgi:hypothetical protein